MTSFTKTETRRAKDAASSSESADEPLPLSARSKRARFVARPESGDKAAGKATSVSDLMKATRSGPSEAFRQRLAAWTKEG